MKVLVLCAAYPDHKGSKALSYVHIRNKYYLQEGIVPVVLNFSAKDGYEMDGIKVITLKDYQSHKDNQTYDWLVCHAPNVRNHYQFLKKYDSFFPKIMFVFHGHEIVKINKTYPVDYDYIKKRQVLGRKTVQNLYDDFKLHIWSSYFPKIAQKSQFVFVSNSLYNDFKKYVGDILADTTRVHIIYNSVGQVFEKTQYNKDCQKKYDFITIRSNMDSSVYCLDIVTRLAKKNPERTFLIIGKGDWFVYHDKPDNVYLVNKTLSHDELVQYINDSRFALMPTRRDSQGVMTCELMTYGIPVITSDIAVCREICDGFDNYILIDNENVRLDLEGTMNEYYEKTNDKKCAGVGKKNQRYFARNTTGQEVHLLKNRF